VVAETGSSGRLRRLTKAALSADSAIKKSEEVAVSASLLIDDLSIIVDRLDGAETGLEDLIAECRREVAGLGYTRREAHSVVESVNRILELVEWFLTPAFVAREQLNRSIERVADLRRGVIERLAGEPAPRSQPRLVELAEVHRLAG